MMTSRDVARLFAKLAAPILGRKKRPQPTVDAVALRSEGRSRRTRGEPGELAGLSDRELYDKVLGVARHRKRGLSDRDKALQLEWCRTRAMPWWFVLAAAPNARLTPAEQAAMGLERAGETAKRLAAVVLAALRRGYNGVSLSKQEAIRAGVATSHGSWWRAVKALDTAGVVRRTCSWRPPHEGRTSAPVEHDRNHYTLGAAFGGLVDVKPSDAARAAVRAYGSKPGVGPAAAPAGAIATARAAYQARQGEADRTRAATLARAVTMGAKRAIDAFCEYAGAGPSGRPTVALHTLREEHQEKEGPSRHAPDGVPVDSSGPRSPAHPGGSAGPVPLPPLGGGDVSRPGLGRRAMGAVLETWLRPEYLALFPAGGDA